MKNLATRLIILALGLLISTNSFAKRSIILSTGNAGATEVDCDAACYENKVGDSSEGAENVEEESESSSGSVIPSCTDPCVVCSNTGSSQSLAENPISSSSDAMNIEVAVVDSEPQPAPSPSGCCCPIK